ncbi:hypothetical protein CBP31_02210 [Oceanisphaera profunda]|uniref:Uncharacterized protein n=1 Tax=Oceanisphaera profunda TaxID=1416627 RepID=A0A1Y0D241_9GAMM|nr:hypothetical protein [Oceanisphaera profunda]ART81588.1 hypothetical protein CBP31_02210 [Oceanisphaera profunda]
MTDKKVIRLLKILMIIGFSLIILGAYLHLSDYTKAMGVNGILLSAGCIAVGMVLSLPTKMYLTFVFMNRENDKHKAERAVPKAEPKDKD